MDASLRATPRLRALIPLAVLGGCGLLGPDTSAADAADVHAGRLLGDLVEAVSGDLDISGERIAAAAKDTATDRLSVHYRMRLNRAARTALGYRDPHVGLLDLWTLCLQTAHYLTEGDGAAIFGPHQPLAVAAAERSLTQVAKLAGSAFGAEEAVAAERDVAAFARRHPMRDLFSRIGLMEGDVRVAGDGEAAFTLLQTLTFDWINPLSGFGSDVSESAEAVGAAMDRFTVVAEFLPRQIGWQLELFVYDLQGAEVLQRVAEGVAQVGNGVEGVASVADGLPARVRAELTAALREVDPLLDNVRRTLTEARASAQPVEQVGATWGAAAAQVDAMTRGVTEALAKFDGTYRMLTDRDGRNRNGHGDSAAPPAQRRAPFDIRDWDRTAQSIQRMSEELERTLARFQGTIGDPELDDTLGKAKDAAGDTIATATLWIVLGFAALTALVVLAVWCVRVMPPGRSPGTAG